MNPMRSASAILASLVLIASVTAFDRPNAATGYSQEADGKQLYLKNCRRCHGVLGEPTKDAVREDDKIPRLSDAALYTKLTDKELFKSVKEGKGRNMKSFADKLSDKEIETVVQYIHTLVKPK